MYKQYGAGRSRTMFALTATQLMQLDQSWNGQDRIEWEWLCWSIDTLGYNNNMRLCEGMVEARYKIYGIAYITAATSQTPQSSP